MIHRILKGLKRDGIKYFIVRNVARLLGEDLEIQRVKNKVLKLMKETHNGKVAYGPFKGMQLTNSAWWSSNDFITQTLGIYEEHVLKTLVKISGQNIKHFVDIGAADGYYAIGMLYSNLATEVVAFEIAESGRESIKQNAINNNCLDKISINAEANENNLLTLLKNDRPSCILIDIEGGEFDLLNYSLLKKLKPHYIICELHPWLVQNGFELEKTLIKHSSDTHNFKIIKRECYNPNEFSELDDLTDEERLIAVGEGRGKNMSWLVLTPK